MKWFDQEVRPWREGLKHKKERIVWIGLMGIMVLMTAFLLYRQKIMHETHVKEMQQAKATHHREQKKKMVGETRETKENIEGEEDTEIESLSLADLTDERIKRWGSLGKMGKCGLL